jgi:hypothetical protein
MVFLGKLASFIVSKGPLSIKSFFEHFCLIFCVFTLKNEKAAANELVAAAFFI